MGEHRRCDAQINRGARMLVRAWSAHRTKHAGIGVSSQTGTTARGEGNGSRCLAQRRGWEVEGDNGKIWPPSGCQVGGVVALASGQGGQATRLLLACLMVGNTASEHARI